jgi:hypothetical protein
MMLKAGVFQSRDCTRALASKGADPANAVLVPGAQQ